MKWKWTKWSNSKAKIIQWSLRNITARVPSHGGRWRRVVYLLHHHRSPRSREGSRNPKRRLPEVPWQLEPIRGVVYFTGLGKSCPSVRPALCWSDHLSSLVRGLYRVRVHRGKAEGVQRSKVGPRLWCTVDPSPTPEVALFLLRAA